MYVFWRAAQFSDVQRFCCHFELRTILSHRIHGAIIWRCSHSHLHLDRLVALVASQFEVLVFDVVDVLGFARDFDFWERVWLSLQLFLPKPNTHSNREHRSV